MMQGKGVALEDRLSNFFGRLEDHIQKEFYPVFVPVAEVRYDTPSCASARMQ